MDDCECDDILERIVEFSNKIKKMGEIYMMKIKGEYGTEISSYRIKHGAPYYEKHGFNIFVNFEENNYSSEPFWISSFTFYHGGNKIGHHIEEQIYSNRTEFFINDEYVSSNMEDLDEIFGIMNDSLLKEKWLINFIKSDNDIMITEDMDLISMKNKLNSDLDTFISN